jgi:hypothetical protein
MSQYTNSYHSRIAIATIKNKENTNNNVNKLNMNAHKTSNFNNFSENLKINFNSFNNNIFFLSDFSYSSPNLIQNRVINKTSKSVAKQLSILHWNCNSIQNKNFS